MGGGRDGRPPFFYGKIDEKPCFFLRKAVYYINMAF